MIINHNMSAVNANRQMAANQSATAKSTEKLSSGLRINRAGDDAAGLSISEKMRAQISGLNQASRNAQDGISMLQTAEGALNESHSMLQRIRELSVQSNNGTNTDDDLSEIQKEINELTGEITRVGEKTEFNTKKLLDGNLGVKAGDGTATINSLTGAGISLDVSGVKVGTTLTFELDPTGDKISVSDGVTTQKLAMNPEDVKAGATLDFDKIGLKINFAADVDLTKEVGGTTLDKKTVATTGANIELQVGANQGTILAISISNMKSDALGTGTGTGVTNLKDVNITSAGKGFDNNIQVIDKAIKQVSQQRSSIGAYQNRLEHTINNLGTSSENLTAAESRVRDVDMAEEMMEFTKNNVLSQASQAMLAQAKALPNQVLSLLQ